MAVFESHKSDSLIHVTRALYPLKLLSIGGVLLVYCTTALANPMGTGMNGAKSREYEGKIRDMTCQPSPSTPLDPVIDFFFQHLRPELSRLVNEDACEKRFQLLVTEVFPNGSNPSKPNLQSHGFRVDAEYLYPASTIKIFASLGALFYWAELREKHPELSIESPLSFGIDDGQKKESLDATHLSLGRITMGHELRKIHLVSSNFAYNRLYDLVGHQRLNTLFRKEYPSLRLRHRLSVFEDEATRRKTPPFDIEIQTAKGVKRISFPGQESRIQFAKHAHPNSVRVGRAYIDPHSHQRIDEPMDFTDKNSVSLKDLQRILVSIRFPKTSSLPFCSEKSPMDEWLRTLRHVMALDPAKSENPVYSDPTETELRFKRMMSGLLESGVQREDLIYLNKGGKAYGFHLENAYLEHKKTKRALFITFGLYTNPNGVLNDNQYGYVEESEPVFHDLGRAAGQYLLQGWSPTRRP